MTQHFIGIDPGLTGGIAVLDSGGVVVRLERFDRRDLCDVMHEVFDALGSTTAHVALERVHARPGQGVCSMFTFGTGYGKIQGWLAAKCIDFELYTPQAWQRPLPLSSSPKDRVKKWALKNHTSLPFIFAGCRIMHQGCMDAAAIADYHRCILHELIDVPTKKVARKKLVEMKF